MVRQGVRIPRQFDYDGSADPPALPDAQASPVQTAGSNVLAERSVEQGIALLCELIDSLGGNQQQRFDGSTVNEGIRCADRPQCRAG